MSLVLTCELENHAGTAPAGPGANEVTINISPPLADQQCCTLQLTGGATGSSTFRVLAGDVDQSGRVTGADEGLIVERLGEPASPSNFWLDMDLNGIITPTDVAFTKARLGNATGDCAVCGACCLGGADCVTSDLSSCQVSLGGTFLGVGVDCPTQTVAAEVAEPGGGVFIHIIEAGADCGGTGGKALACVPGTPIDAWESQEHGSMCQNFGVTGSPAIPADFFGPGSDRFPARSVCAVYR